MQRQLMPTGLLLGSLLLATAVGEQRKDPPNISPEADQHLKAMSRRIADAPALRFSAYGLGDEPLESGHLAQYEHNYQVTLKRPDRLFIDASGDVENWAGWYNGKTLTLLDKATDTFAVIDVPGHVEHMMDELAEKHGVTIPLADLLVDDPYESLTRDIQEGAYLGRHHVDGVSCHHLMFTQENIDWQIWIDAGERPVPRKVLIVRHQDEGMPRRGGQIYAWDFLPALADDIFEFPGTPGLQKVGIEELLGKNAPQGHATIE